MQKRSQYLRLALASGVLALAVLGYFVVLVAVSDAAVYLPLIAAISLFAGLIVGKIYPRIKPPE